MASAFNQMNPLSGRTERPRMGNEPWPWSNVGSHVKHSIELLIGVLRQQRDHRVLECYDTNAKLRQLRIC
jgi:hypothetical protein